MPANLSTEIASVVTFMYTQVIMQGRELMGNRLGS